ncbi:AEC family transporter [Botryobacter ruber]|uniref:AEC family transporter n=1 Tax=Botryobacter ruber TaxID=2171629 RepID=UPI000E0AAA94|nr:AEC family transporter [Botryobacter ruber]
MSSFILLFLCLVLGVLLRKVQDFPANTPLVLNQYLIYVALPALALNFIPEIHLDSTLLLPVGVAWISFSFSALIFWSLGKMYGWSRKLTGCMMLMGGLGNTSFIGFPVVEALYGPEGLKTAILVDQPGSFVVLSTLGIAVAASFSQGQASARAIVHKIFTFPPFLVFLLALCMNVLGVHFPAEMKEVFQRLGSTLTPLALVSVGMQLRLERRSKHWNFVWMNLFYQLLLSPAIIFALYVWGAGARGEVVQISILQAAMAPMITPSIVAAKYGLKPRLASMFIGIGIPLSILTVAFWYWVIRGI